MKKGPLSNKEKDFIKDNIAKAKDNMSELAAELGRSPSVVEKFASTLPSQAPAKNPNTGNAVDLYAKNEERGVTVMTETASMAADESKKSRKNQNPERYTQYIHKIKE